MPLEPINRQGQRTNRRSWHSGCHAEAIANNPPQALLPILRRCFEPFSVPIYEGVIFTRKLATATMPVIRLGSEVDSIAVMFPSPQGGSETPLSTYPSQSNAIGLPAIAEA